MSFELHPEIRFRLRHIGQERQPLVIVDNLLADPDAMVAAAQKADFYVPEHTNYPGLNAALPEGYHQAVITGLRGPIETAFGLRSDAWIRFFGFLALATTSAAEATPVQKIPHSDSPDPGRLAWVHYLCKGDFGGTGFFRHRATGFESIGHDRRERYTAIAAAQLGHGEVVTYADAATDGYELIEAVPAVFNRLILYRTPVLHSAMLNAAPLSSDPAKGRLTANGFIEATCTP